MLYSSHMDVPKQVAYWRDGVPRALRNAAWNLQGSFNAEALFRTHLAVKLALKANVAKRTRQVPPRIHNLKRLAEIAGIVLDDQQLELCGDLMEFHISGRYPEERVDEPSDEEARMIVERGRELAECLTEKL